MKRRQELPIVSGILVAANVIVYLICTFTGNLLYNIGELDAAAVLLHREYGRIIYSMFLHAGIDHLFNNMVILFFLGAMIEKVTGHIQLLLIYLLSGIGANICSLLWTVWLPWERAVQSLDWMVCFWHGSCLTDKLCRMLLRDVYFS